MNYETCAEIEIAVAKWFGIRQNLIVPNVSWGLGLHECDLLVLTNSGYAYEVEIKISKSDLVRDAHKYHQHQDYANRIRQMYFAIPNRLYENCASLVPITSGILVVGKNGDVNDSRAATVNTSARKFTEEERYKLARLGTLRIWGLKEKMAKTKAQTLDISV